MNDISGADPAASSDADNTDLEDSEDSYHPRSDENSQNSVSTLETDDTPQLSTSSSNSTLASRSTAEKKREKRKRNRHCLAKPENWRRNQNKTLRMEGQKYFGKGKQMLQGEKQPEVLALLVLHRLVSN